MRCLEPQTQNIVAWIHQVAQILPLWHSNETDSHFRRPRLRMYFSLWTNCTFLDLFYIKQAELLRYHRYITNIQQVRIYQILIWLVKCVQSFHFQRRAQLTDTWPKRKYVLGSGFTFLLKHEACRSREIASLRKKIHKISLHENISQFHMYA